jgi:hypothetical protein
MHLAKQEIEANGGIVTGEIPNVTVSFSTSVGEVRGICRLVGEATVNIEIIKNPWVMTCAMAREKLVYYITEAVKIYMQQNKTPKQEA